MRYDVIYFVLTIIFVCLVGVMIYTCMTVTSHGQESVVRNCLVYKVVDGDTIKCSVNDKKYYVRFIAVDTPEITWGKNECYGKEAKQYLIDNIDGKPVTLTLEGGKTYGRVVAWVSDNKNLYNLNLILAGYGRQTTERFPTKLYPSNLFVYAEGIAVMNDFGGWGSPCSDSWREWYQRKTLSDRSKIK